MKKLREAIDLTQTQVATQVGLTPSPYSKIESGVTDPSVGRVEQLTSLFKIKITDFFTDPPTQVSTDAAALQELHGKLNALTQEMVELKKEVARLGSGKSKKTK